MIAAVPRRVLEAPPVAPGESLIGLVRSCAWLNGLPSVGALLREAADATHAWSNLALRSDVDADRLAVAMRLPAEEVAGRMHRERRAAPHLLLRSFFGVELRSHDLVVDRRSFAPAALASAPHHRATWQVGLLPFCTETGELLVDRCENCSNHLEWAAAKRLTHCSTCRRPVSTGTPANVGVNVLDETARFTALLRPWDEDEDSARATLHDDLRNVPSGAVFDLAWSIARFMVDGPVGLRRMDVGLPAATKVAILRVAAEIMAGWPESLDAALRRIVAKDATGGRRVLARLRGLFEPRIRWPEQHELLARTHPHLLARTRNAAHAVHGDAVDAATATSMLGISADLLPRLVAAGAIEAVAARRGIHLSAGYDGASLRRLGTLRDDCISMESVSERLGVTLHGVEQLVCLGLMLEHDEPAVAIMHRRRQVSRSDFDRLVGRIVSIARADINEGIPLRSAVRVIGGREKPWGQILRLIADGLIPARLWRPETRGRRDGGRLRALVDNLHVSKADLPLLAEVAFDVAVHADFRFATSVSRRDMEDTLNINPGHSAFVLSHELSEAVLPSGRLDKRAVLALATSRISPGEISARYTDFSRRLPKAMRVERVLRLGTSGWDRASIEHLLAHEHMTPKGGQSPG
ncbi:hypothetical protein [Sphingomonas carotinifaciens]|uniref:TniQ protein n=1 Tax=Sphingomonas carotinifaciens TaxID=1166323 RepID=A0A1G7NHZ2_9SPHN|nr:hypothetical protein [Sphingomonas carotinifaciens]MBB4087070.1 hypothetical protein [Sphingomonas carotinifaciens]MWC43241.1 hypothetical protein [Sphingomonas carotinifaciens]SDF73715.1 hypothetical protein SAMN05216557_105175 [Sphingomonas carotinifaciens]